MSYKEMEAFENLLKARETYLQYLAKPEVAEARETLNTEAGLKADVDIATKQWQQQLLLELSRVKKVEE